MDIRLKKLNFVDNRYSIQYGVNKVASFIVIQESFLGNNKLGVIDRVNIFIEIYNEAGEKILGTFGTSVIGIGDNYVGIYSEKPELAGKLLTWDNMEDCVIRLYE